MTTAEIITKVRKKLPRVVLISLSFGVLAYFFTYFVLIKYKSETSFYINEAVMAEMNKGNMEPQGVTVMTAMAGNRVLLLLCSDELRDSIVKQFDLYKHYRFKKDEEFSHEKVLVALNKSILIRRDQQQPNLIHLDVEDPDRFMAANIANTMVERVNQMNRDILRRDMKRRIAKYETVLSSLKQKESGSRKELLEFIDSLNPLTRPSGESDAPSEAKYRALSMIDKVDANSTKYQSLLEEYYTISSSMGMMSNDEWQTITINKKALPDVGSGILRALAQALIFTIFLFCTIMGVMIYIYQNDSTVKEVMDSLKEPKASEIKA